ncbi:hypothetical protein RRG08_015541 [Elysia crispata]|uniref:Uncharacterized protein n=1 Tax=Elysia crispata TaxID=231223 RepID=A0AAE1D085_9GAST|nr:hypothetical protein RRG08_015541 [Elysia crispata]
MPTQRRETRVREVENYCDDAGSASLAAPVTSLSPLLSQDFWLEISSLHPWSVVVRGPNDLLMYMSAAPDRVSDSPTDVQALAQPRGMGRQTRPSLPPVMASRADVKRSRRFESCEVRGSLEQDCGPGVTQNPSRADVKRSRRFESCEVK